MKCVCEWYKYWWHIQISNHHTRLTFSQNNREAEISYCGSRSRVVAGSVKVRCAAQSCDKKPWLSYHPPSDLLSFWPLSFIIFLRLSPTTEGRSFGSQWAIGKKFQLDPLHPSVAMSRNLFGEREKNQVYPLYRPATSEYKSIELQQDKLFSLSVMSLRVLILCNIYQG
jgi:hypothetical protein